MAADIEKITKAMNYFATHTIEIGILAKGDSVDGVEEMTILKYGSFLEFGSPGGKIKPRGYFRRAIEENGPAIELFVQGVLNQVLSGNLDGRPASIQVGHFIRGLVIQSIASASNWSIKNTPEYEKWKAKKYPNQAGKNLILDGYLIKSIRYQIVKNGRSVHTSDWNKVGG
ncbi:MAG: hypothetical protein ACRDAS_12265 [Cetobacterium sp.]